MSNLAPDTARPHPSPPSAAAVSRLLHGADVLDRLVKALCVVLIVSTSLVLLIVLGVNVVARYALQEGGLAWAGEISAQLFPWLIAGGVVLAAQRGAHIAVDLIYTLIGQRGGKILAVAIHLLILLAYAMLFLVAAQVAEIVATERSPLLHIPNSWGYFALMFAAAGTSLSSLTTLTRVLVHGVSALPQPAAEESPL